MLRIENEGLTGGLTGTDFLGDLVRLSSVLYVFVHGETPVGLSTPPPPPKKTATWHGLIVFRGVLNLVNPLRGLRFMVSVLQPGVASYVLCELLLQAGLTYPELSTRLRHSFSLTSASPLRR